VKRPGILERLRADHERVLEGVREIERVAVRGRKHLSAPMRAKLVRFATHLDRQFATHLRAEDEVLYPALARKVSGGSNLVAPLHVEHAELCAMLESFQAALAAPPSAFRDEQIVVQLRDLVDLLRIHIRKEETLLFGVAERLLAPEDLAEIESFRHGGKS
jgi:hemerythrin-like domain-containing protein